MKLKILIPVSILLFSLVLIIIGHIYVTSNASKEVEYATNILRRETLLRGSLIEAAYNRGEMRIAYSYLKGFSTDPDIRTTRLIDSNGKILLSLSPSEEGKHINEVNNDHIGSEQIPKAFSLHIPLVHYDEHSMMLEIAYQVALRNSHHMLRPNNNALLVVRRDISRDFAIYQHKETIFAYIIAAVLSVLSLFLWFMLDRQITRPLTKIQKTTRLIASGDLSSRAQLQAGNEIGDLAQDINYMAEALQQSQSELAEIIARMQTSQTYGEVGIWEWRVNSSDIYWSDVVYKIFGVDPEHFELNFENYQSLIQESDRETVHKAIQQSLESGHPYEVRHRIVKNGDTRWIVGRGNVEYGADGKPIRMLGTVQDITQQVNYQNDLKTAYDELNHQLTALNQHCIVSVTDDSGIIQYVNNKFIEVSGYHEKELIGNSLKLLNSGQHSSEFWYRFWHTISMGKIWDGEICNRRKDGQLYWVKTTVVPHIGDNGLPDRYTAILTDITELKNAQDRLHDKHTQLQAVAAINNAYLNTHNPQQVFKTILNIYLDYSKSDIGFIGSVTYRHDEKQNILTTLALSDISWDETSTEIYQKHVRGGLEFNKLDTLYGQVLASGKSYFSNDAMNSPHFGYLPEGHPKLDNFCGIPLYYGHEFIGMLGLANRLGGFSSEEIQRLQRLNEETARIMNEVRLRQHNNRLLHAINNSSSEIFIVEPGSLRILDTNPSACNNLGYTPDELKQLTVTDITVLTEANKKLLLGLGKNHSEIITEAEHIRKDGSHYPVEGRIQLITDDTPHVLVGIIQDISDRKASEQRYQEIQKQLFQSQKMEALGHLTGGIAHDFNNMLASILGYSELSLDIIENDTTDSSRIKGYLAQVITASKRARDLITQMLSFSRTKTDSQDNVTDVKPVISEVISLLRSSLPTTMQLDYSIETNLPSAHIQPVQLHQILMNLCINARDAMQGVGNVSIEASHCSPKDEICNACHTHFEGDYICIKVSDNGSGIPSDSLERIFEPFYTTKETGKGTGMGLSVVHGIVHGNNGHIQVNSTSGGGTSFMIYLPVSERRNDLDDPHSSLFVPDLVKGIHAVVVDDDASVGNFLREMLELNEVQTRYFHDSRAALEHLRDHHEDYDILITDMTMPKLTGMQLSEELAALGSKLPVILCSGYNSEKIDQEKCRKAGIHTCLTKPIDTHELLKLIGEIGHRKKHA